MSKKKYSGNFENEVAKIKFTINSKKYADLIEKAFDDVSNKLMDNKIDSDRERV